MSIRKLVLKYKMMRTRSFVLYIHIRSIIHSIIFFVDGKNNKRNYFFLYSLATLKYDNRNRYLQTKCRIHQIYSEPNDVFDSHKDRFKEDKQQQKNLTVPLHFSEKAIYINGSTFTLEIVFL